MKLSEDFQKNFLSQIFFELAPREVVANDPDYSGVKMLDEFCSGSIV
jgi:hypothetical protein